MLLRMLRTLTMLSKKEIEAIAEAVHARLAYDACPECGALSMYCAKLRGANTCCGVTDRPIKNASQSWDEWLDENRKHLAPDTKKEEGG